MAIFHKYYAFEHCMVWLYGSLFLHKSIFGVCSFGWIVFFTHAFCRWMTSYKLHLTDTIERMNKGQNIQGRMRGGGKSRGTPPPSNRSILKKPSIVSQACSLKKKITLWKPSTSWSIGYVSYHCGNYFTILHEIFLLSLFNLVYNNIIFVQTPKNLHW